MITYKKALEIVENNEIIIDTTGSIRFFCHGGDKRYYVWDGDIEMFSSSSLKPAVDYYNDIIMFRLRR